MKKTLIVLATLAATAGVAQAANVTLYGAADLGLSYKYQKVDGEDATHKYGLESGNLGASKFGLKGEEDLGNGYAIGFKLENGFKADSGELKTSGKIFDREAAVTLKTPFGSLAAGRMGALSSGAGTYDIFQAYGDVFDGGVGDIGAGYWHGTGRYDNMLTYATPDMAGFKVYAQYSFASDAQEAAGNERNNNRYWGIGAAYDNGPLALVAVVDSVMPQRAVADSFNQDSYTVSVGGSYNLGSVKPFVGVQYGEHMNSFAFFAPDATDEDAGLAFDLKGYAVSLGGIFQLPVGSLQAGVFYAHAKGDFIDADHLLATVDKSNVYGVGLVHSYPLSKRTTIYSGVGYSYQKTTYTDQDEADKVKSAQVLFGINHTF